MKQEILRFKNVTRKEDGAIYLDNFNFYMTKGEIVGMLSVNDRGKKELLKLLSQNSPIESGHIYFDGILVNSWMNRDFSNNRVYVVDEQSSLIENLSHIIRPVIYRDYNRNSGLHFISPVTFSSSCILSIFLSPKYGIIL